MTIPDPGDATPRVSRGTRTGLTAMAIALVALVALTLLPTPYVIQRPGPVYDVLGSARNADGDDVPLIEVDDAETFPTDGALSLTTVQIVGNRERTPSWFELAMAWADSSRAVLPIEAVFPEGVTVEQRQQRNATLMVDSQQEAIAAALNELEIPVESEITVVEVMEDGAAADALKADDVIVAADGEPLADSDALRAHIQQAQGEPIELTVERAGERRDVQVTPRAQEVDGTETWLIGVVLTQAFTFPIDVALQLDNVGGPSAGMMFALGIYDVLTPGALTDGAKIAGTGTINAEGAVGPIGGIRQKLYGARDAGAQYFLAPEANCDEVVGHVPEGLQVIRTSTLEESIAAIEAIADGKDVAALPTCTADVASR